MQGKKNFHFGNEIITIDTSQIILLKRGIYSISKYTPDGRHFEALMIFVPDKFLKEFHFKTGRFQKATKQKSLAIVPSDELLNSFKSQYLNYFGRSSMAMEKILQLKLHELFLLLTSSTCKTEVLNFIN